MFTLRKYNYTFDLLIIIAVWTSVIIMIIGLKYRVRVAHLVADFGWIDTQRVILSGYIWLYRLMGI